MISLNIKKDLDTISLDINLSIKKREFIAISGISGSGKTTLLRILAGLEKAKGTIKVEDKVWLDNNINLSVQKRDIGFVFQEYALFTNMSVEQNLLYVKNDKVLADKLLDITELSLLKTKYPNTLSGGQKQRVALCRAMMQKPKLLLLDEPLSALDIKMRAKLQQEILTLHNEFETTTVLVSHDPSEIYKLCSRIIIIDNGKIIKDGSPKDVLLKTQGSQKFSFKAEVLDIKKVDVIYIAILAIGQQIVEIVVSSSEVKNIKIGDMVNISTKAFSPTLSL